MKRTIVKFGAAVLLMGMFALVPACKSEAAEEATEETTETVTEAADAATDAAADVTDTSGGKDPKTGGNPPPTVN
jgi:hypothetical protein